MGVGAAKSALLEHGEHPRRRVRERPELDSPQPEDQILRRDHETRDAVARRITEDEQTPRVFGGGTEKPFVVRVAADDAVEHDHVGRRSPVSPQCWQLTIPLPEQGFYSTFEANQRPCASLYRHYRLRRNMCAGAN
jgi:hypothetical protein